MGCMRYLLECQAALSNIQCLMDVEQKFSHREHRGHRVAIWGSDLVSCQAALSNIQLFHECGTKIHRRARRGRRVVIQYKPPLEVFNHKPAPIPNRHCPCTILPLWYLALEVCVFKRMVFRLDGEPFHSVVSGRCF